MTNKLRLITLSLLGVFALFLGISFYLSTRVSTVSTPNSSSENLTEESKTAKKAVLTIDFGEGEVISSEFEFKDEKSAFDLLQETADKQNIDMRTTQYDFGVFVNTIKGRESTIERAWIYFVNGVAGQVSADKMKINDGDVVDWKYISPPEE